MNILIVFLVIVINTFLISAGWLLIKSTDQKRMYVRKAFGINLWMIALTIWIAIILDGKTVFEVETLKAVVTTVLFSIAFGLFTSAMYFFYKHLRQ